MRGARQAVLRSAARGLRGGGRCAQGARRHLRSPGSRRGRPPGTAPRPRARCGSGRASGRLAQRLTCSHPSRGQGQEAGQPEDAAEARPEGRGHGGAGSCWSVEGTRLDSAAAAAARGSHGTGCAGRYGRGAGSSSPRIAVSLRAAAGHSPPRRPRPTSAAPRPLPAPSLTPPHAASPHDPPLSPRSSPLLPRLRFSNLLPLPPFPRRAPPLPSTPPFPSPPRSPFLHSAPPPLPASVPASAGSDSASLEERAPV